MYDNLVRSLAKSLERVGPGPWVESRARLVSRRVGDESNPSYVFADIYCVELISALDESETLSFECRWGGTDDPSCVFVPA